MIVLDTEAIDLAQAFPDFWALRLGDRTLRMLAEAGAHSVTIAPPRQYADPH
jgi:hypothetical protein